MDMCLKFQISLDKSIQHYLFKEKKDSYNKAKAVFQNATELNMASRLACDVDSCHNILF